MTPKISVVIPSYNKVKFIRETLESIVSQNYENFEIIVQDGGSTDGTLEIIKNYAKKYPRNIKWESKKDNGQLDAINKGMNRITGDILAFINADDVYKSNAFNSVAGFFSSRRDALWFAGRGIIIDEKSHEIAKIATWYKNIFLSLNLYFGLLVFNYVMQPSVFITRKAWEKYGPFIGTKEFVMEYDLWLKIGKIKMPVVINKTLSSFRIESLTKTKTMFTQLLAQDQKIAKKFTKNSLILFLHDLHNFGRIIIEKFV